MVTAELTAIQEGLTQLEIGITWTLLDYNDTYGRQRTLAILDKVQNDSRGKNREVGLALLFRGMLEEFGSANNKKAAAKWYLLSSRAHVAFAKHWISRLLLEPKIISQKARATATRYAKAARNLGYTPELLNRTLAFVEKTPELETPTAQPWNTGWR